MIELTEAAKQRITELLAEENNPKLGLRVFVRGGGCSGMSYGFAFDEERNEDDHILEQNGWDLLVDSMSAPYLYGATINFKEDLNGRNFTLINPNAETSCGCGSSFAPRAHI